jgi:hypothetical protein
LRLTQPLLHFGALKRRWSFIILGLVLLLFVGGLALQIDWRWKRKLSPWGGRYFFHRLELAVPSLRQGEEKWRDDPLGGVEANGTLGGEGCAVAAAAMVFKFYGIEVDPQKLNWFLTSVGGYTENGWLYWDRAAWLAPDRVRHVYEDLPSYQLIDSNLAHGNPVIARVRLANGITHFVVIAGKDGFDYLVRDPGGGAAKGFYPLREINSDIEALRFYQPLTNPGQHLSAQR